MARLSAARRRSMSIGKREIMELDAAGTKKLVRRRRVKDGWQRQYRGSLSRTVRFFKGLPIRKVHLDCLKKTPFYNFILPFVKGKYSAGEVRGSQDSTVEMLMTYNSERNCFTIGGKHLRIEPKEFDLIFGIRSGETAIRPRRTSRQESELAMRKFSKYKKVSHGVLKQVLQNTLNNDDQMSIQDSAKIIIIHLLSCLFFVAGADQVNMWFFRICDKLEMLGSYNWGLAVINYLMKSIQKRTAESVSGCTILFMYWLCEHVKIVNPQNPSVLPRYRRWRLRDMGDVLTELALKDIQPQQVRSKPIRATEEEEEFLNNVVVETENSEFETKADSDNDGGRGVDADNVPNDSDEETTDSDGSPRYNTHEESVSPTNYTPIPCDVTNADERDEIKFEDIERFTDTDSDHVPIAALHAKYPSMLRKIYELEIQVSMLEATLGETKAESKRWETKAEDLVVLNDSLEDELHRLNSIRSAGHIASSGEASMKAKVEELKKQLRNEMIEKINLRAEVEKSAIDIGQLQHSNTMLIAELEKMQHEVGLEQREKVDGLQAVEDEKNRDFSTDAVMHNGTLGLNDIEGGSAASFEDCGNEEEHVKNIEMVPASEFRTPEAKMNSCLGVMMQEPSFALMSQSLDEEVVPTPPQVPDIPLTYVSPSQLEIIDLHTSINQMKLREMDYLKELSTKEAEIQNLNKILEPEHVLALPAQPNNELPIVIHVQPKNETPKSMVAKRTRSHRTEVTPYSMNAQLDLGKNYKNYHVYRQLHVDAQKIVDDLVSSPNKARFVLWSSEDDVVRVFIPDIFALIRKKALSNNVIDSYCRIMMIEQRNGRFDSVGDRDASGRVFVFDSMLLQRVRSNGHGMIDLPPDFLEYRYLIFPILHKSNEKARVVDHWTVLVVDNCNGDVNYYNSMLPRRRSSDPYLRDANEVRSALFRTGKQIGVYLPYEEEIEVIVDAPQQEAGSVDCGAVVLYVVQKHVNHEPIVSRLAVNELKVMRANIVNALLLWGRDGRNTAPKRRRLEDGSGPSSN